MKLRVKGKPANVISPIVGRVVFSRQNLDERSILITSESEISETNGRAVLTSAKEIITTSDLAVVFNVDDFSHLEENDIVAVGTDGNINTLYRINASTNTILATERCNSNCLMCSQPPRDKNDIEVLSQINKELIPLVPKDCVELGISGGEPTLLGEHFFEILELIEKELPKTEVHVLTNGRSFAFDKLSNRFGNINHRNIMLGIPLYSDDYLTHDYIVQAENAFYQTVMGIQNLARYNARIEIRIVLHKLTIPRLFKLSQYIYKNFPYVEHVAFMGLEFIGYTPHNIDKLWIDPYDYQEELKKSILFLDGQGMRVSIYNTALCLLPVELWQFARKSISDWKNDFMPECKKCSVSSQCGGFFSWNLKKPSQHISPIL
jgi:His-Xaa-Ser system radical SAM maturase HxsC